MADKDENEASEIREDLQKLIDRKSFLKDIQKDSEQQEKISKIYAMRIRL